MLHRTGRRPRVFGLAALSALVMAAGVNPAWAGHGVTAVEGSAYGYRAYNISFFGGAQSDTGPTPSVALTSNASNSPQSASATTGLVYYQPAVLFTSDDISVSSTGSLGSSGSVSSSSSVDNINQASTQATLTGSEILTADDITGSCTKNTSTTSGSTSITNGVLRTDSGWDANDDGDYIDAGEHAPAEVNPLSSSPAANTTYYGHIHLNATDTDNWKVVFNEQSTAGGTLTVNAVHEYFGETSSGNDPNSVLQGDLIIGRAVCGLTVH